MLKSVLVQINPTVGALQANADLIIEKARTATDAGAQLIIFPELTISGYPPEDLVLKDHFCADCEYQLKRIAKELPPEPYIVVGAPVFRAGARYNAAIVFHGGEALGEYHKMLLPNYGVFDEKRLFEPGAAPLIFEINGKRAAVHICEDSWFPCGAAVERLKNEQIDLLINLSASPYHRGKLNHRIQTLSETARKLGAELLYANTVGGQDGLVFDGASMVFSPTGELRARAKQFQEDLLYFDHAEHVENRRELPLPDLEEVYTALTLGLRDYVNKIGFKRVVVALSGGIDSALVLAIAVDALGKERVASVTMPSQYSSSGTLGDAHEMARILDIEFHEVPIKPLYEEFKNSLAEVWGSDKKPGLAEENLQARIRGNLIMALSNEYGWLVLTTGNKSEMAMGYCTIYGDMAGGFAVIKDVPKTLVFDLCRWRNEQSDTPVIPPSIIERPPSAELRHDQKDTDSLPPYDVLDPILMDYVENDMGIDSLTAKGYDEALVRRVVHAVELSEYKRRQSPPGVKITPRSFDRDRRMPIVNRYRN
ncbi:MAG: NAD+ synthase [Pontiellaceae bacterium]|nr:NAD+ synthase [Pontiellaceae bacterium]